MELARREALFGAAGLALAGCATTAPADSLQAAFFYGFTLYEFARTAQERSGAVAGRPGLLNQLSHRAQLADHTARQVTAPNNDTVYSSAFLELSGGPVEVVSPTSTDRYFSIAFMDAFTDNFAYIGTRATKGQGGVFWIVGPGWRGEAPGGGVTVIRSTTNDVWMLGRVVVDGPSEPSMAAVRNFQSRIRVSASPGRTPRSFGVRASDVNDPAVFLGVVNDILTRSPGGQGHTARARRFAAQGIGAPASPEVLAAWRDYLPKGQQALREAFQYRSNIVDGWSYQEKGVGDFGTNDRLRASTALGGLAALGEEEAMYFHANFAPDGSRLTGAQKFLWRVPPGGVPAEAFWSLTMYQAEPDGRYFLVENPINRFAIGDRTPGLARDDDGSIPILIQRERPQGRFAANWLPAPAGPMRLALRAYLPKRELLERRWRVPALSQV